MTALDPWIPRLLAVWRATQRAAGREKGVRPRERLAQDELRTVAAAVRRLSLGLTRERSLAGERYFDDPALLGAYLLFYWPVSFAQIGSLLPELPRVPRDVLDVGGGPGPAAFAALGSGAERALVIDRSEGALKLAQALAREAGLPLTSRRWTGGALPEGPHDLVVAQHLLNELWGGDADRISRRASFARSLLDRVRPGGTLLLVDPALRETSRELLLLRDVLVGQGISVRAPCLFRGACPALARPSDWCHAERVWQPPPLVQEIARAAGLHKEALKMSYLALAPVGEGWPVVPEGKLFRIVSEPLAGKGRRRYMGCGPDGRMGLALQHRHGTEENRLFGELQRGDVVRVSGWAPKGDGVGLGPESEVRRLARAGERLDRR
ncbi:MAG: small ribosomal subunit Rsm22 family protein [Deltaproteobacteria bacterium]